MNNSVSKIILIIFAFLLYTCNERTSDFQKNNKINGVVIKYKNCEQEHKYYSDGLMKTDIVIDTCIRDTIYYSNGIVNKFYDPYSGKKFLICITKTLDSGGFQMIAFDTLGKIYRLKPPIDFLSKLDSQYFNKDFPDWQEQIKAWEAKNKTANKDLP